MAAPGEVEPKAVHGLDATFMDQALAQLKVMLIEHDEPFAHTVTSMLEQAHDTVVSVSVAPSLEQTFRVLEAETPDLVILEFFLPDGAGLMNIPLLREHAPRIPIIVIGAADDEAFALEAVHAGAQDYLVKGQLNKRGLLRSIRYTMERHAAEMAAVAAEDNPAEPRLPAGSITDRTVDMDLFSTTSTA